MEGWYVAFLNSCFFFLANVQGGCDFWVQQMFKEDAWCFLDIYGMLVTHMIFACILTWMFFCSKMVANHLLLCVHYVAFVFRCANLNFPLFANHLLLHAHCCITFCICVLFESLFIFDALLTFFQCSHSTARHIESWQPLWPHPQLVVMGWVIWSLGLDTNNGGRRWSKWFGAWFVGGRGRGVVLGTNNVASDDGAGNGESEDNIGEGNAGVLNRRWRRQRLFRFWDRPRFRERPYFFSRFGSISLSRQNR